MVKTIFTCIGKNHGANVQSSDKEKWTAIRNSSELSELCRQIEFAADEETVLKLKAKMPVFTPRCAKFEGNRRREDKVLAPLNRLMFDIDEKGRTDDVLTHLKDGKIGEFEVLLIEESVRRGTHVYVTLPKGMTPDEAQKRFSSLVGINVDPAVKNVAGCIYMVSADHERYVSEKMFDISEASEVKSQQILPDEPDYEPNDEPAEEPGFDPLDLSLSYNGIAYNKIIDKYWELYNDGNLPAKGDRNSKTFELAVMLRSICDYSVDTLKRIIPRYDGFPEKEFIKTIENAVDEPRKGIPYRIRAIMAKLKNDSLLSISGGQSCPPPMPKRLPHLIRLLTDNVPDLYKPATAMAVFPALATHIHGVTFKYWDNNNHEPKFLNLLVAPMSVGKGCIKKPIDLILEDIVKRDQDSRLREAEWKRLNPSNKSKAKDPRPDDICIQVLIDNLTDAVFNQRVIDADKNGHRYLYLRCDEVEGLKKVTSSKAISDVTLLIRNAFDNSMTGQERVGADSVTGIAPLRWNFNVSTTPTNARKFFGKSVNDGTLSRLCLSTIIIPDEEKDSFVPIMRTYTEKFNKELKPYLKLLDSANGNINCKQAIELSKNLRTKAVTTASLYGSEAYRKLSYRANVIAWQMGMVLYIANNYRWTNEIANFVEWAMKYDLWCKMLFFGQQLERELEEDNQLQFGSGPQNMLDMLPREFSKEEYRRLRMKLGRTGNGDATLRSWINRKYIEFDETSRQYHKTDKYLLNHCA